MGRLVTPENPSSATAKGPSTEAPGTWLAGESAPAREENFTAARGRSSLDHRALEQLDRVRADRDPPVRRVLEHLLVAGQLDRRDIPGDREDHPAAAVVAGITGSRRGNVEQSSSGLVELIQRVEGARLRVGLAEVGRRADRSIHRAVDVETSMGWPKAG